ncbi:MAG: ABC transporter permease [Clostridiales bacterium]|nr:ABC transporter permease [Eubacteriales bacterium]MDH7566739.1 ABC transporter permease [Clostridiales bacterium]
MSRKNKITGYLAALIFLFAAWYGLSFLAQIPFLPSPAVVFVNIKKIFISDILVHLVYSLWRIAAGITASVLVGIPLGLCMGYYKTWDKLLSPVVYFTYPIPKIALIPLIMLIFGLGELSKIAMIFLIVVFQIIVSARDSGRAIPKETFYSLYSLGAGSLDIFRRVILPASLPGLLTSIRISLGTSLSVLFFTETFGTQYGMGYFIMDSWMRVNYIDMFSGILVLSVAGFLLFFLVDLLERLLCPWKP